MLSPGSDISVVVQGPVMRTPDSRAGLNMTDHVLHSVRNAVPGCEVVLSTWEGADLSGLTFDKLVLSPDPGPCDWFNPFAMNVNRQLVSTLNGLKAATRPLAVKLRSDTIIEFPAFLEYQHRQAARGPGPALFRNKIVACSLGTVDFRKWRHFFSVNDFFFFGNTGDLLTLFDVPPAARPAGAEPHTAPFVTEQYIMVQAMRKAGIPVEGNGPWPGRYRPYFRKYGLAWERFLFGNFILAHPSHLGLMLSRRLYTHMLDYPPARVDELYHLHCERPRGRLPLPRREMLNLLACYLAPPR